MTKRLPCTKMMNELIQNIYKLHTTPMGAERIKRNLALTESDPVTWCREKIMDKGDVTERKGKNWYIHIDACTITVNAGSYTIITAHREC